ncbi:MAG: 4Fe-4S dicluster domain-containing protein [Promethearchaeota archaeon]
MKSPIAEDKVLFFDDEKCTGCRYCESACSLHHHCQLSFNLSNITISSKIVFKQGEESTHLVFSAALCIHCDPAPCQIVCPSGAIQKEANGRVFLNELMCIGCRSCTFACSLSIAWFHPETHLSYKCDLCDGDPQCVDVCSVEAIRFLPRTEVLRIMENIRV